MGTRTGRRRTLASFHRVHLLHLLLDGAGHPLAELAQALDVHENTAREHLQRLVAEGWVAVSTEERHHRGRPRTLYRLVTEPVAAGRERARHAVQLGESARRMLPVRDVTSGLSPEAQAQLDVLTEHLEATGFDPDIDEERLRVSLTACPFRSMVDEHRSLVCDVHHALICTTLAQEDGPIRAGELRPFDTPGRCTLDLETATDR